MYTSIKHNTIFSLPFIKGLSKLEAGEREVRKSRGESTHPKTQQLHVLPQSIQPLTSGKAAFIKNLSDRKRNVRRASIRSKRINGCNHTRGHITTTRYDSVTTRVWISVDDLSFSEWRLGIPTLWRVFGNAPKFSVILAYIALICIRMNNSHRRSITNRHDAENAPHVDMT